MRTRWVVVVLAVSLVAVMVARRSSLPGSTATSTATPTSTATSISTSTSTSTAEPPPSGPETPAAAAAPPAALAAGAYVAIHGIVVDGAGRPVPGETVQALAIVRGEERSVEESDRQDDGTFYGIPVRAAAVRAAAIVRGEESSVEESDSRDDGTFTIQVPAGEYEVRIWPDRATAQRVVVRAPARGIRVELTRSASIEGELLDADGRPVVRGLVTVASVGDREGVVPPEKYARTDAGGRFRAMGLAGGTNVVLGARHLAASQDADFASNTAVAKVELAPDGSATITLRLGPERTITGTVVDETGSGVAGADLWARSVEGRDRDDPVLAIVAPLRARAEATSGADGRFTFEGLPEGRHLLRVEHTGYEPIEVSPAIAGDHDVRIVLRALGQVRGRVLGDDGAPIARFVLNGEAIRAADGRFSVPAPRRDLHSLRVEADGYAPLVHAIRGADAPTTDVGDLHLVRGRVLRGQVVDAETRASLGGAEILMRLPTGRPGIANSGWEDGARCDAEGRFTLEGTGDGLEVQARKAGYAPATLAVGPGQTTAVLGLGRAGRIAVRALEADGAPLTHLLVMVLPVDGDPYPVAYGPVDGEGRYVAADLAPGTYAVRPWTMSEEDAPLARARTVSVVAGQTASVELRDPAGGATVVLKLVGPGAAACHGADALAPGDATLVRTVRDALRTVAVSIMPDRHGIGPRFKHVEPGRHTVLIMAGDDEAPRLLAKVIEVGTADEQIFEVEVPEVLPLLER